jgi:glucosylceramidase
VAANRSRDTRWTGLVACGLLALVAGCAASGDRTVTTPTVAAAPPVMAWTTSADHRLALHAERLPYDASTATADISIDATRTRQQIVGFGAAITDASAWVLQHDMTAAQRAALLRELFGRDGDGIGLNVTRLTIGASDFSRRPYSLDDMPRGARDPQLAHFSIAPNLDDVVPVTRQALAINPGLQVMASPWSAPGWMKNTDSLIQGTLRDDADVTTESRGEGFYKRVAVIPRGPESQESAEAQPASEP